MMQRRRPQLWQALLLLTALPAQAQGTLPAAQADPVPALRLSQRLDQPPPAVATDKPAGTGPVSPQRLLEHWANALPASTQCRGASQPLDGVLSLTRALELALCRSPAVQQALASVREQTAVRDLAGLAWRPQVSAYLEHASNRIPSSNSGSGSLSASMTGSLGLSWVIFDFGVRSANLEQARQSLAAAIAAQDSATLNTLRDALKLYVEASAAWARLDAQQQAENLARQSAEAARAKYQAFVASLAEKLQAETALAQATLERVRAQGTWRTAASALAIAMGQPATVALRLPDPSVAFPDLTDDIPDADALAQLREQHPRIRSLRADTLGLQARLASVQADGKGALSMSGSLAGTRQLGIPGAGVDRAISTSLVASVPLFNGDVQAAREAQVVSQLGARQAALEAAQRDIDTTMALALQQLEIEQQNQTAARSLLDTAVQGHEVALGRYKAGVGSIIELLAAQSALSNARSQQLQAAISRANAQISLAVAAGRLGNTPTPAAAGRQP